MTDNRIRIGKIVGCHGVRGDLKVRPFSEKADWTSTLKAFVLRNPKTGEEKEYQITAIRPQGPLFLVKLDTVESRTLAEPLIGSILYAERAVLPVPGENEYWVDDLIDLSVVDIQNGRKIGAVKDLLSSGGSDFLEIQLENSRETVVVPFIEKFFPEVNLETRTVSVDLLNDFFSSYEEPVTSDRLVE